MRALPDFAIAGAMKSGTTSLFSYLMQHPKVVPPYRKEVHFFGPGHHAGKSSAWYRGHFPLRNRLRNGAIRNSGLKAIEISRPS